MWSAIKQAVLSLSPLPATSTSTRSQERMPPTRSTPMTPSAAAPVADSKSGAEQPPSSRHSHSASRSHSAPAPPESSDESDSNQDDDMVVDDSMCQVCFNGDSLVENKIIFCSGCEVAVHQLCYGVAVVPDDDWFCARCTAKLSVEQAPCVLCPIRGGALKPCDDGRRWAHITCALWTPETHVGGNTTRQPVLGVDQVLPDRWRLRCMLCKRRGDDAGVCVQCCFGRCTAAYHPICAFEHKLPMIRAELAQGGWALYSFCGKHRKEAENKDAEVPVHAKFIDPTSSLYACKAAHPEPMDTGSESAQSTSSTSDAAPNPPSASPIAKSSSSSEAHVSRPMAPLGTNAGLALSQPPPPTAAAAAAALVLDATNYWAESQTFAASAQQQSQQSQAQLIQKQQQQLQQQHLQQLAQLQQLPQSPHTAAAAASLLYAAAAANAAANAASLSANQLTTPPNSIPSTSAPACDCCGGGEEDSSHLGTLLECGKCHMRSHAICYGRKDKAAANKGKLVEWLCDPCSDPKCNSQVPPSCCLCCEPGGALKVTDDGRWAHIFCANWMPEISFPNPDTMSPVAGCARVEPLRFKLTCALCQVRQQGACIQCHTKNCRQAFHPRCARRHGLRMEFSDVDQGVAAIAFCDRHRDGEYNPSLPMTVKPTNIGQPSSPPPSARVAVPETDDAGRTGRPPRRPDSVPVPASTTATEQLSYEDQFWTIVDEYFGPINGTDVRRMLDVDQSVATDDPAMNVPPLGVSALPLTVGDPNTLSTFALPRAACSTDETHIMHRLCSPAGTGPALATSGPAPAMPLRCTVALFNSSTPSSSDIDSQVSMWILRQTLQQQQQQAQLQPQQQAQQARPSNQSWPLVQAVIRTEPAGAAAVCEFKVQWSTNPTGGAPSGLPELTGAAFGPSQTPIVPNAPATHPNDSIESLFRVSLEAAELVDPRSVAAGLRMPAFIDKQSRPLMDLRELPTVHASLQSTGAPFELNSASSAGTAVSRRVIEEEDEVEASKDKSKSRTPKGKGGRFTRHRSANTIESSDEEEAPESAQEMQVDVKPVIHHSDSLRPSLPAATALAAARQRTITLERRATLSVSTDVYPSESVAPSTSILPTYMQPFTLASTARNHVAPGTAAAAEAAILASSQSADVRALNAPSSCDAPDRKHRCTDPLHAHSHESAVDGMYGDADDPVLCALLEAQTELAEQVAINNRVRAGIREQLRTEMMATVLAHNQALIRRSEDRYAFMSKWQVIRLCLQRGVKDIPYVPRSVKQVVTEAAPAIAATGDLAAAQARERALLLTGPIGGADGANREDDSNAVSVCCVCFDGESNELNPIVFCERCNISVHKSCYGMGELPDGDWNCDTCAAHARASTNLKSHRAGASAQARARNDAEEALCIFCPVAGGALKRTEDGRWGHVVCVLWNPTIRVRSIAKMEPIENYVQALQQAADRRKSGHGICSVCHDPHGLTIPCRAERSHGCLVRLHPLCAWYHGNYMSVRSVVGPDDQVSGAFSCYCDAHSSGAYFQAWLSQQPQALQQAWVSRHLEAMRIKQVAITAWQQQQAAETQQAGLPVNTSLPLPSNVQTALQTQITQLFADLPAPPPRSAQQQAEMRNLGRQDQLAMRRLAGLDRRDMRSNDDRYEAGRCAVCFETDADESNPLVPCSRCSIYVHAWCYGISTPVSGAEWCCRRCEKRSQKKIECAVCPRKGGALKPTSDGRWAHVTCGLWLPECRFLDMIAVEPLTGLRAIPAERFALTCHLCKKTGEGACIQCTHESGCAAAFHPLCAMFAGLYMRISKGDANTSKGSQSVFVSMCRAHTPLARARITLPEDFNAIVRLRRDLDKARTLVELCKRRERFKRHSLLLFQSMAEERLRPDLIKFDQRCVDVLGKLRAAEQRREQELKRQAERAAAEEARRLTDEAAAKAAIEAEERAEKRRQQAFKALEREMQHKQEEVERIAAVRARRAETKASLAAAAAKGGPEAVAQLLRKHVPQELRNLALPEDAGVQKCNQCGIHYRATVVLDLKARGRRSTGAAAAPAAPSTDRALCPECAEDESLAAEEATLRAEIAAGIPVAAPVPTSATSASSAKKRPAEVIPEVATPAVESDRKRRRTDEPEAELTVDRSHGKIDVKAATPSPAPAPAVTPRAKEAAVLPPKSNTRTPSAPVAKLAGFAIGDTVLKNGDKSQSPAVIIALDAHKGVRIHFKGWNDRYDEWLKPSDVKAMP